MSDAPLRGLLVKDCMLQDGGGGGGRRTDEDDGGDAGVVADAVAGAVAVAVAAAASMMAQEEEEVASQFDWCSSTRVMVLSSSATDMASVQELLTSHC